MTPSTSAPAASQSPHLDGKFLRVDGERFLVKGVSYGTFAPDADGAQFPAAARVDGDFAAMAASGINTVRTYTVPSTGLLDAAARHGLRVMVGIPWSQHLAFLDQRSLRRQIRREALATVRSLATHPAALLFAVGNEIPAAVVRWHGHRRVERFLRELYHEIKDAVPGSLLTYVNFPPTEYLELDCFDVAAFNVYLHREADLRAYLARLQHIAGLKPLLLAEAGADSRREGVDGQARITAMHLRAAFAEGACGAVAFAWTDQWWRGGQAVEDWTFGLVDADRRPKPALAAVERAFADAPFPRDERARWPSVSVVVCAHNAADTIDDCLTSLGTLTYPRMEVIVVNDGSRDRTAAIASRYAGVRVIDLPHGGLSVARNVGLAEATGEIVAYTDADVRVDPDWLTHLVQPLIAQDVIAAGGPNVVPPDDPWLAQCVARAPGGPTHVLLDDRIAEHIPGCNMAFRREALLAIGGFDPAYVRAGDDVDVCWRLQARGLRIGFSAAALVWHHHRASVTAFWRQQVGYGEAETWLHAHHPEKFATGDMLWHGRIYSPLPFVRSFQGRRINTGMWGTAAFPSVYSTRRHPLQLLPHSPGWMTACSALCLVAVMGLPSRGAVWLMAAGLLGWMATLARCIMFAWRSDLEGLPPVGRLSPWQSHVVSRTVIAWLHLIQPLARMRGRIRGLWSLEPAPDRSHEPARQAEQPASWRSLRPAARLLAGLTSERSFWGESWVAHTTVLSELARVLRTSRPSPVVTLDDGWHADRDLSIAVGRWGWLRVRVLVEEHAQGRCLLRARASLRPSHAGFLVGAALAGGLTAAAGALATLGGPWLGALPALAAAAIIVRGAWRVMHATGVLDRALGTITTEAGMRPLPAHAGTADGERAGLHPAVAVVAVVATIALLLLADRGVGGVSIGRYLLSTLAAATTPARRVPDATTSGGVAVGIAGDVFVADARHGFIRRLRPRPPLDASWTADDIGTDGDPLLGHAVPFDSAADIAVAPNGDLYIADARHNQIRRMVPATGRITTVAGTGRAGFDGDHGPANEASLHGPSAIAVGRSGDIYVADTANNRIRMIAHATGVITTVAGDGRTGEGDDLGDDGPGVSARLNRPSGLAVAANGNLYVSDTGHHRVRRIDADTAVITTIAGDGRTGSNGDGGPAARARLAAPMGLAILATTGRIYVADHLNNRVRVIDPSGTIATLEGSSRVVAPTRVAYHSAGWLYVKDASPDGVTAVAAGPGPQTAGIETPAND